MSILIAVPLLFLLPGYALTLTMPWVRGFSFRLAVSIITSVALGVLLCTAAAVLHLPMGLLLGISMSLVIIAGGFFFRKKLRVLTEEWKSVRRAERLFIAFLFLLSVLGGVFAAYPHYNYPWPIHADEWWVVGTTQNLIDGLPLNTHPYLFTNLTDYKPGFTSYMAGVLGFMGSDPIRAWPYLPAVNVFLISFISSLLLFHYSKKFFVAGSFPFFLAALRSNAYILGWWFFVPSTFAFFFMLPLFLTASDWLKDVRAAVWAFFVFVALALVYLPFAMFSALPLIFLVAFGIKKYRSVFLISIFVIAAVLVIAGMVFSPYREYWTIGNSPVFPSWLSGFIHAFFVPVAATFHFVNYTDIFGITGILMVIFGLIGILAFRKEQWANAVGWGAVFGCLNMCVILLWAMSFLEFHQRALYFLGVMVAIMASLGAGEIWLWFSSAGFMKKLGRVKYILAAVFCGLALFSMFAGYFKLPNWTLLYYLVRDNDLAAMNWLRGQSELKGLNVVADPDVGTLIAPFTRLPSKVSFLTTQNVAAAVNPKDIISWSAPDTCEHRRDYVIRMNAGIVYAHAPQSCPFLSEIYSHSGVFIYRVEN